MARALTLQEFAENMRRKGDIRDADLADEILALLDIEETVAEPYSELCDDLNHYAPSGLQEKPEKALEWLGDRSNLLRDIEKELEDAGHKGDVDDVIKAMIEELANWRKRAELPEYDL